MITEKNVLVLRGDTLHYEITKEGFRDITGSEYITAPTEIQEKMKDSTWVLFTINPTPADATVVLTADGYTQEGNSIWVKVGTQVTYNVSKDDYATMSGSVSMTQDMILDIELEEKHTFTITVNTGKVTSTDTTFVYPISAESVDISRYWTPTNSVATIDWGDGTTSELGSTYTLTDITHNYAEPGEYKVSMTSTTNYMPRIYPGNGFSSGNETKIISIDSPPLKIVEPTNKSSSSIVMWDWESLTSIPEDLFLYNHHLTNFEGTFALCSGLTSIPEDLFKYNTEATTFGESSASVTGTYWTTFAGCSGLTSIPENLFKYNTKMKDAGFLFSNCSGLTSIPENLFKYNTELSNIGYMFGYCSKLTSVPDKLFENNLNLKLVQGLFEQCRNLISCNIKIYSPYVYQPRYMFESCTKLTSVGNIFEGGDANTSSMYLANDMFRGCTSLKTIPENFFSKLTNINSVSGMFYGCTSLETVPDNLFASLINCNNYTNVFRNCNKLKLNPNMFGDESDRETRFASFATVLFDNSFSRSSFTGTEAGTAPELWKYTYPERILEPLYAWKRSPSTAYYYTKTTTPTSGEYLYTAQNGRYYRIQTVSEDFTSLTANNFTFERDETRDTTYCNVSSSTCFAGNGNNINSITNYDEIPTDWGGPYTPPETNGYKLTINPSESDATVVLEADGYTQEGNSIAVDENVPVSYKVIKNTYYMETGTVIPQGNEVLDVQMREANFKYKIDTRKRSSTNKIYKVPFVTSTICKDAWSALNETATIDWGDGTTTVISGTYDDTTITHTYSAEGEYLISITTSGTHMPVFTPEYDNSSFGKCVIEILTPLITVAKQDGFGWNRGGIAHCFRNSNITTIPEDTLQYNKDIQTIACLFKNSTIQEIPAKFFHNLTKISEAYSTFDGSRYLTTLPEKMWKDCPLINSLNATFTNCSSLRNVPDDLFEYITVEYYTGMLFQGCTNLRNIPSSCYKGQSQIYNVDNDFKNCASLTSIPEGLFDDCSGLVNLNYTFENCTSLETIPDGLFKNLVSAQSFQQCFAGCSKLTINPNIFGNETDGYTNIFANKDSVSFVKMFYRDTFTGTNVGTAPSIWEYAGPEGSYTSYGWKSESDPIVDWYTTSATPESGEEIQGYIDGELMMGTVVESYDPETQTIFTGYETFVRDESIDLTSNYMNGSDCFGGSGNTGLQNIPSIPDNWK